MIEFENVKVLYLANPLGTVPFQEKDHTDKESKAVNSESVDLFKRFIERFNMVLDDNGSLLCWEKPNEPEDDLEDKLVSMFGKDYVIGWIVCNCWLSINGAVEAEHCDNEKLRDWYVKKAKHFIKKYEDYTGERAPIEDIVSNEEWWRD